MILSGLSLGSANTVLGAMWAELYGTRYLGSIRAVASAGGVFASVLAPGLMGVLLDYGVSVTSQLLLLAGYTLVSACMLDVVAPRWRREITEAVTPSDRAGGQTDCHDGVTTSRPQHGR